MSKDPFADIVNAPDDQFGAFADIVQPQDHRTMPPGRAQDYQNTQPQLMTNAKVSGQKLPVVWNAMVDGVPVRAALDQQAGAYLFNDANGKPNMLIRKPDGSLGARPYQYPGTNPTEGMSRTERAMAGAGKSIMDTGRGIGQLFSIGQGDKQAAEELAIREQDKPLMDTGAGKVGYVGGALATMVTPGVLLKGAGAGMQAANLARGAQAVDAAGNAILIPKTLKGAAALGAAQGAVQPAVDTQERLGNTALGAGAGVAGQAVGSVAGRAVSALGDRIASRAAQQGAQQSPLDVNVRVTLENAGIDVGKMTRDAQQGLQNLVDNMGSKLTPDALVRIAKAQNLKYPVPLTAGSALGDYNAQQAESMLALTPQGVSLRQAKDAANEALTRNLEGVAAAQKPTATELYPLGKSVQGSLAKAEDSSLQKVGALYGKASQTGETAVVDPAPIVSGLMKNIDAIHAGNDAGPALEMANKLKRRGFMAETDTGDFVPTGKKMSASEAMELYKAANQSYKAGSVSSRHIGDIKRGILDALDTTQAGPEFRAATAAFKEHASKYDNPRMISDLLKTNAAEEPKVAAEKVFDRVVKNGSIDDIKSLKQLMLSSDKSIVDPVTGTTARQDAVQAFRNIRASLANHLLERSFIGNAVNESQAPVVSGTNLINAVRALGGGRLESNEAAGWAKITEIMGPKAAKELKDIADTALSATRKVQGAAQTSGTAERLISLLGHVPVLGGPTKMVAGAAVNAAKNQLAASQARQAAAGVAPMMVKQAKPVPLALPAVAGQSALSR